MKTLDWVRRFNYQGNSVGGGEHLIPLDPDELIDIAKTTTGLSDFGKDIGHSDYYTEITNLIKSGEWHTLGRILLKTQILIALRNRLYITNAINQTPTILNEPIDKPLIVTGLPRSGTTILFELLSQDSRFRSPHGFEIACPSQQAVCSTTGGIGRKELAQCIFDFHMDIQPETRSMHDHRHNLPAECYLLIRYVLGNTLPPLNSTDSYESSIAKINSPNNYHWHKKVLQLLQYEQPTKPWLLKCPSHLHFLEHLFKCYPNARIIHLHRDPVKSIPSAYNLHRSINALLTELNGAPTNYRRMISEGCLRLVMKQQQDNSIPMSQIVDIHFQDLMADPVATIMSAYEDLSLEFNDEFGRKILEYLSKRPRNKYGTHNYNSDEFGFTNEEIREQFLFYTDHYNVALEN